MRKVSYITKKLLVEYGIKRCPRCNTIKKTNEFHFNSKRNILLGDIYFSCCKECRRTARNLRYDKIERIKLGHKKQHRDINIIKKNQKDYYLKHKDKLNAYQKIYYKKNKHKVKEYIKRYVNKNPENKLKARLRTLLAHHIRKANIIKDHSILHLIGCTIIELKQHLENKFTEGMTWDNYGKWHIDHIIPCFKFDHSQKEDIEKCWHYTNLQPLWALDNIRKSNK